MAFWGFAGALFSGLSVLLGAFAAHGLKNVLSVERLNVFETGVKYQMYHGIALILVFLLSFHLSTNYLKYAAWFFSAGVFLFSGSLYALVLLNMPRLGMITPLGGVSFLVGWFFLCMALYAR